MNELTFTVYNAVLAGLYLSVFIVERYLLCAFVFVNVDHTRACVVAAMFSLFGNGITFAAVVVEIIDGQLYGAAIAYMVHDIVVEGNTVGYTKFLQVFFYLFGYLVPGHPFKLPVLGGGRDS